jgi:DNA-binding NarL/FixJ family response regulator
MIALLIVDDHPPVRRALRAWLAAHPDITIVGEASDGATAVMLAARLEPDVVLMDIEMPGMDGIAATAAIRLRRPSPAVVAYSVHDDPVTQSRAHDAGAVAFVAKHRTGELLLAVLRSVVSEGPDGAIER